VRQTVLRDWISGSGHPGPCVEVPYPAVEKLAGTGRDRGPAASQRLEHWVGIAVEVADGLSAAAVYRRETYRDDRDLRRQLRGVQKQLATAGVLPWGAFNAGIVPADWESSPALDLALEQWHREAKAIDAMDRVINGLTAGLTVYERTADAELARRYCLHHLRSAA